MEDKPDFMKHELRCASRIRSIPRQACNCSVGYIEKVKAESEQNRQNFERLKELNTSNLEFPSEKRLNSIFKYKIKRSLDGQVIELPAGSKILTIQDQYNVPTMWVLVNIEETLIVKRTFRIYFTGEHFPGIPETFDFIGTVQMDNGIVLHVFEEL